MTKNNGRTLLVLTIVLTFLGLFAVADASAPQALAYFHDSFYYLKEQIVWAILGFAAMFAAMIIDYSVWKKFASIFFAINVVLLLVVLIPGIGSRVLGARRWISIGSFTLQPSELIKVSIIFYIAKLADLKKPFLNLILPIALVAGLIMFEPDLGTTIVVITIGLTQLFVAGVSLIPFAATGIVGGLIGFLLTITSSYRRARLETFLNASSDPLNPSNYHIRQVLIALGSGGFFGVGLGQGKQKYLFLPESATDSVFANIAEELGFLGAIVVIGLLCFFIYKCMQIATHAPDNFSTIVATGIIAWFCAQIFLNLASMVALIPLTGVPLPFFSYGGSSLTVILFSVGVLLNISKHAKEE
ncbi:MAG TPA: putative lipid II flippase FtsW [Patescibacteria group bacterium]|nr:putative lipid II flippase FtsW [Patescibacteria group bacterium]